MGLAEEAPVKTTLRVWLPVILGAIAAIVADALDGEIDWTWQYLLAVAAGLVVIGSVGSLLVRAAHRKH